MNCFREFLLEEILALFLLLGDELVMSIFDFEGFLEPKHWVLHHMFQSLLESLCALVIIRNGVFISNLKVNVVLLLVLIESVGGC